jgi:hypothetical protein
MDTKLINAYSRLKALGEALPEEYYVAGRYIVEFDSIVDELEQLSGFDLRQFRVRLSRMEERAFLMRKIDALLTAFEFHLVL